MIVFTQRLGQDSTRAPGPTTATLTLDLDSRLKSRGQVQLDDGRAAGLMLVRGQVLRGGELLTTAQQDEVVQVIAAHESVSTVWAKDALLLMRIGYHLGNRHVPLQISHQWLRYQHDHVLDEMVIGLGGLVKTEQAPFEPEAGAYQSAPHGHGQHHAYHHH